MKELLAFLIKDLQSTKKEIAELTIRDRSDESGRDTQNRINYLEGRRSMIDDLVMILL